MDGWMSMPGLRLNPPIAYTPAHFGLGICMYLLAQSIVILKKEKHIFYHELDPIQGLYENDVGKYATTAYTLGDFGRGPADPHRFDKKKRQLHRHRIYIYIY